MASTPTRRAAASHKHGASRKSCAPRWKTCTRCNPRRLKRLTAALPGRHKPLHSREQSDLRAGCHPDLFRRVKNQLLHPPVEQLAHIELVLRGARDLVNPSELLHL